jgi:hypothetical protein
MAPNLEAQELEGICGTFDPFDKAVHLLTYLLTADRDRGGWPWMNRTGG